MARCFAFQLSMTTHQIMCDRALEYRQHKCQCFIIEGREFLQATSDAVVKPVAIRNWFIDRRRSPPGSADLRHSFNAVTQLHVHVGAGLAPALTEWTRLYILV